jgi:cytochrome P450
MLRYEDAVTAAHDPGTFSSKHQVLLDDYSLNKFDAPPLDLDPPAHGPFRRILLPLFSPSAVAALRPLTQQVCDDLLDRLAGRARIDASADYARHIPVAVIAAMLGIPDSDAETFRSWVHDIVECQDIEVSMPATRQALAYFRAQIAARREEPG